MAYIYCHLRSDDCQPFYVGISRAIRRPFAKGGRSDWHKRVSEKHGLRVEIISELEGWDLAQQWERHWIKALKAANYELVNQTPGGDGGPTWTGRKHTEETKKKMSLASRGNKGNKGKIFSEEHRQRLSESQIGNKKALGRKDSEETKLKKSLAMKGKKHALGFKRSSSSVEKSRIKKQAWWNELSEEKRDLFREKIRLSWINRRGGFDGLRI